jgi:immune inhibitor A
VIALASLRALATVPPEDDRPLPRALTVDRRGDFTIRNGFIPSAVEAKGNRLVIDSLLAGFKIGPGPTRVSGTRQVPVIPIRFKNTTAAEPIDLTKLQNELFGQWPTGSLTDFYLENSYGTFTLTGVVGPWRQVSLKDVDYEGQKVSASEPCNGLCSTAQLRALFQEAIGLDLTFDWARFDSDRDGLVDFVIFVQPERGGECSGSTNIWSHQGNFDDRGGPIPTASRGADGKVISINDYVIVPALACNSSTMIQIGVFAHEIGHAFGLPDLYDTDKETNGNSAGLGNWCLMSGV